MVRMRETVVLEQRGIKRGINVPKLMSGGHISKGDAWTCEREGLADPGPARQKPQSSVCQTFRSFSREARNPVFSIKTPDSQMLGTN
jgi:hypothetical protein